MKWKCSFLGLTELKLRTNHLDVTFSLQAAVAVLLAATVLPHIR